MTRFRLLPGASAFLLFAPAAVSFAAVCEPVRLRVESQVNPLGVDAVRPLLTWQMKDARRGARQTGYRILVASRPELLRPGKADLWDSLERNSDRSIDVAYGGKRLESRGRAFWTVQVRDKDGRPSPWAKPARWEVPLLNLTDWKAQWIGVKQAEAKPDTLEDAQWIWAADAQPGRDYPSGKRWFFAAFELPNKPIKSAMLVGAVDEQFTAFVNGQQAGSGNGWVTAASLPIQALLKPGRNSIFVAGNSTGGLAGLAMLVRVTFEDGTTQRFTTGPGWEASTTEAPPNATGSESFWQAAAVLGPAGPGVWGMPKVSGGQGGPAQLLRKTFSVGKPVKSARVYVTARGSYRLHINGARVGNDILTPDWTDYRKRIPYQIYDVTKLLRQGENAVGAILGDGWYASGLGWALQRWSFGPGPTQFLMQLEVEYADGSRETVVTNGSWKAAESPIQRSEIYAGETYDARKEQPGWDQAGFKEDGWRVVDSTAPVQSILAMEIQPSGLSIGTNPPPNPTPKIVPIPGAVMLVPQSSPTLQQTTTIKPVAITNPAPGVAIYDMGQNMVGWVRIKVRGGEGETVRLRFAEILKPNGHIYTDNLRRAEATDSYTCRGGSDEVWEPHFTYHGFRYVEVTGRTATPATFVWNVAPSINIEGIVFHTNAPETTTFACSNPMVNQLWHNVNWGLKGNLHSVPTDCPQRDERLGWMGDAQIIWPTAAYLRDVQSFTHKWMRDVVDAQSAEGGFSDVSPRVIDEADGAPAWGDAGIVLPYTAWKRYGDTRIIEETYGPMRKWVEYIRSENPDNLWMKRRNNDFGDWVAVNDTPTDKSVIATAYYAQDARMLSEMARAIGRGADADQYEALFRDIRAAFQKAFVKEDGVIGNGSQTCYVLAMHMRLLTPEQEAVAMRHLVADVERHNMHHTTGFIGTPFLMLVLSEHGRDDIAYTLLLNDTFPSWGYMIAKGATTMWERWNGDTGDPAMNSFNHYAYGAVGEWMVRHLGGIDRPADGVGFQRLVIRPRIDPRMTWANTSFDSPYGRITSNWSHLPGQPISLNVIVPANTSAYVCVPTSNSERVTESGLPIDSGSGIRFVKMEGDRAVYEVPAGSYRFEAR